METRSRGIQEGMIELRLAYRKIMLRLCPFWVINDYIP